MIAKFFGQEKADINYQLDEQRHECEVLRGNPAQTKNIINDLDYSRNWASGTLAFKKETSPEQLNEIMDSFENWMSAGIGRDRMNILWVKHSEKDHQHIHFTIPQVDLESGKQVSWYVDSRDRDALMNWQDMINIKYDLEDPRAIENKRITATERHRSTKQEIYDHIQKEFVLGRAYDRKSVLSAIEGIEGVHVARETKNAISVRVDGQNRNIRLNGEIFKQDFQAKTFKQKSVKEKLIDWAKEKAPVKATLIHAKEKAHKAHCKGRGERLIKRCTRKGSIDKNIHNELKVEVKHDRTAKDLDKSISESIKSCAGLAKDVRREIKQSGKESGDLNKFNDRQLQQSTGAVLKRIRKVSKESEHTSKSLGRAEQANSFDPAITENFNRSVQRRSRALRIREFSKRLGAEIKRIGAGIEQFTERIQLFAGRVKNYEFKLSRSLQENGFLKTLKERVERNAENEIDKGHQRGGMSL